MSTTTGRQAQVLFDYEAQDDDQLSIHTGDVITIVDDSTDLNGWALAQMDDKEGYVPAEYVRYAADNNAQQFDNYNTQDTWRPAGFEAFYTNVLSQEHNLPFCFKLCKAMREVLIPFPCSRYGYVMSRGDLRRGALFSFIVSLLISVVDVFTIIIPLIPITSNKIHIGQIVVCALNTVFRIVLSLIFLARYPRPNLIFVSFPYLNVFASLTYSIRVYEALEMGDNKEYDGYRYYRTWMWCSAMNIPFTIASLILIATHHSSGLIAIAVFMLVWNFLNVGRCFLASWANVESGNDIHPDFDQTIKKYHL